MQVAAEHWFLMFGHTSTVQLVCQFGLFVLRQSSWLSLFPPFAWGAKGGDISNTQRPENKPRAKVTAETGKKRAQTNLRRRARKYWQTCKLWTKYQIRQRVTFLLLRARVTSEFHPVLVQKHWAQKQRCMISCNLYFPAEPNQNKLKNKCSFPGHCKVQHAAYAEKHTSSKKNV